MSEHGMLKSDILDTYLFVESVSALLATNCRIPKPVSGRSEQEIRLITHE
jgi:hypothetical protein